MPKRKVVKPTKIEVLNIDKDSILLVSIPYSNDEWDWDTVRQQLLKHLSKVGVNTDRIMFVDDAITFKAIKQQ